MKRCPLCQSRFTDDALVFCSKDGYSLVSIDINLAGQPEFEHGDSDPLRTEPITEPVERTDQIHATLELPGSSAPYHSAGVPMRGSDEEALLEVKRQFEASARFTDVDVQQSVAQVKSAIENLVQDNQIYRELGIQTDRRPGYQLCVDHVARAMFVYGDRRTLDAGDPICLHAPIFSKPTDGEPLDSQYFMPIGRWENGGVVLRWRYPNVEIKTYMNPEVMAEVLLHAFRNSIRDYYASG